MVGGPSEVYASSRAAVFCAGMNPPSLKDLLSASAPSGVLLARNLQELLFMGAQGYDAVGFNF